MGANILLPDMAGKGNLGHQFSRLIPRAAQ
jgi:hypothetical protein